MGERDEVVRLVEVRVLDGPNLYFTRPAIKLTLAAPGWLKAPESRVAAVAGGAGLPGVVAEHPNGGRTRPGEAGSQQRLRFVARLAAHLTRTLADATGKDVAVRARPGPEPDQVVVAFPWRRRNASEALASEVAALLGRLLRARRPFRRLVAEAAERLARVEPGPAPTVPDPSIPVVAVTGTNGKTTSVRLLAHIARRGGKTVAFSSTDGVYLNGTLVESGDYSGFGGAARALAQPGVEVAILETARGGILLRGIGTLSNDVALVTNLSPDHLGLQGIRTLDQLAEVKATITRITRPTGWDVLNADDPRVLAMRRTARGRPWLFSLDPEHPAIRAALEERGRGMTVIDGKLTVLEGRASRALVALEDVPITLAGISSHNIQNAMGAAAAALALGMSPETVVEGLRTFVLDPETNPGRTNLFRLEGRTLVVDYAHNEAGMAGLVETCRGLRPPGKQIWIAFCTAGDRSNEVLHGMGYLAARGADHVAVAELLGYLRGRDRDEVVERLRVGAFDGGASDVPVYEDEVQALTGMLTSSHAGDVVAVTALGMRGEVFGLLADRGARRMSPADVRRAVRKARGPAA